MKYSKGVMQVGLGLGLGIGIGLGLRLGLGLKEGGKVAREKGVWSIPRELCR